MKPRQSGERLIRQSYEEDLPAPWLEENGFTQLLLQQTAPCGKARFYKVDVWHVVQLGVAKDFVSSSMCLLQELLEGGNIDLRFQQMTVMYKAFCSSNRMTPYVTKLSKDTFGGCGKRDEPTGSWNKAAMSVTMMRFTEHMCHELHEQCQQDERLRMVAPSKNVFVSFGVTESFHACV